MKAIVSKPVQLCRHVIIESLIIFRQHGLRELLRQRGWKFVAGIVAYYLLRDILLYIVAPFLVARGVF